MNRLRLVIVALLCIPAFTEPIRACQCGEYGAPICARFWRSDAVFFGQVIDIKPIPQKPDDRYSYVMLRFSVQESFQGVSGSTVRVGTVTGTSCDMQFKKGKRYFVYANIDSDTNQLFTGACSGTSLAVDVDDALKVLRKLKQRQAEESISGRIVRNTYEGLPGIKIQVKGNGKTLETLTTKWGDFSFSLPGPGSFKVRVLVPYQVRLNSYSDAAISGATQTDSLTTFEYDITLEKSECSYQQLDLEGTNPHATATVAGNVLTATGEPVDTGGVGLINEVDTGPDYFESLHKDGSFKFEAVAPGEYYVVLNAKSDVPDKYDAPYARTYYPGTEDQREAKKIQVTEGATIENLSMRVGQRMSERTVAGTVVWKGGRALEDVYLAVYSGDKYVRRIDIEKNGTFNFILR